MRENRLSGLMRGGQQTVLPRLLPAYSTEALWGTAAGRPKLRFPHRSASRQITEAPTLRETEFQGGAGFPKR